jgi:hypothetical protein
VQCSAPASASVTSCSIAMCIDAQHRVASVRRRREARRFSSHRTQCHTRQSRCIMQCYAVSSAPSQQPQLGS